MRRRAVVPGRWSALLALCCALLPARAVALAPTPVPAAAQAAPRAACVATRGLDATFLQPTRAAALRPRADWERLFADLAAVGIGEVFVQWTWADGVAFYAQETPGADDVPLVDLLLELAERHAMRVWLGLAHDAGWWAGIDRARPPREVEVFLARRRLANVGVARQLAPLVAERASFAGWYVPDEIDDKNWLGEGRTELVVGYLADLGGALASLRPGAGLAMSGFAQGWATPRQLAELWGAIAGQTPVSLALFQDGVGAGKLTVAEAAIDLPLLRAAVEAHGKRLGVVVELFSAAPASPGRAFAAVPAPLDRVVPQLALAWRFAGGPGLAGEQRPGPVVGFSVPDYLSGFGGAAAGEAYDAYRSWAARCATRDPAR